MERFLVLMSPAYRVATPLLRRVARTAASDQMANSGLEKYMPDVADIPSKALEVARKAAPTAAKSPKGHRSGRGGPDRASIRGSGNREAEERPVPKRPPEVGKEKASEKAERRRREDRSEEGSAGVGLWRRRDPKTRTIQAKKRSPPTGAAGGCRSNRPSTWRSRSRSPTTCGPSSRIGRRSCTVSTAPSRSTTRPSRSRRRSGA